MAIATLKLTEFPLRDRISFTSHYSHDCHRHQHCHLHFLFFSQKKPSFSLLVKPFSSLRAPTTTSTTISTTFKPSEDSNSDTLQSKPQSSPLLDKWSKTNAIVESGRSEKQTFDGRNRRSSSSGAGNTAIDRIVLRLRNLGLGSDDEEEEEDMRSKREFSVTGAEKLGDLLKRDWVRPDRVLMEEKEDEMVFPWEREREEEAEDDQSKERKKRTVKAPSLAELTIEDSELRRLRRLGMTIRERINVPKAGVTGAVLEKIHGRWKKSELARLKFHEALAPDMKTAHQIVERRTGGLVIWRSGSVMVVYRGNNYEGPSSRPQPVYNEGEVVYVPNVLSAEKNKGIDGSAMENIKQVVSTRVEGMTEEKAEFIELLDGFGPRFEDWWGTGVLPVDADLLPQTVPGYKTPFRLLPTGMRSAITNAEMTSLRKLAKLLPCHFALGRNRHHQGLAAAIIKLWEKSLVVKIAVKRGIQNTNNELMAEELKTLTGGVLLLRNKYFIVMYRGKDFLPTSVAAALAERQEMTKQIQNVEENVRRGIAEAMPSGNERQVSSGEDGQILAGSLAEFYEAQARWGREVSAEEREKMIKEASKAKTAKVIKQLEHKLAIAQTKKHKAEKLLSKIVASWVTVGPSDDQETITDEERVMFRRVGLRMRAYLPLGIRGVFDGVIENMHLHWKHRELVKLISKEKELAFVEETARLLEYESGGILVAIERISKGFSLIYYRGKNYQRPISLRPRNLLTKAKALKRRVALQRYEALSQHITELEKMIEKTRREIGNYEDVGNGNTFNSEDQGMLNDTWEFTQSEDEASVMDSDGSKGKAFDWEDDEESENSSYDDHDHPYKKVDDRCLLESQEG